MKRKPIKEKDCVSYEETIIINKRNKQLKKLGVIFIDKNKRAKKFFAWALIISGGLTLFLPTGSIFLILLGLSMLGLKRDFLRRWFKLIVYRRAARRLNKIR